MLYTLPQIIINAVMLKSGFGLWNWQSILQTQELNTKNKKYNWYVKKRESGIV